MATAKKTTKATAKAEAKYKLRTVQKRIMALILGDIQDMIEAGNTLSDGITLSNQAMAALAYKWAPFLLEEYPNIPKPINQPYMGIETPIADAEWIANNVQPMDVFAIFNEGMQLNTVDEEEKKS